MHLIEFLQGYWVKQMSKMNEAVGMKNFLPMGGGGKRIVRLFNIQ